MRESIVRFAFSAMLLMSTAAFAQPLAVRSDVPFDFSVNGKALPAGSYEIRPIGSYPGLVQVRNLKTYETVIVQALPSADVADSTRLVFSKIGERYILRSVATAGEGSVDLATSSAERKLLQAARDTAMGSK